jgi:hypothetical protein
MQGFGTKTMAIGDTYTGVTEHFSLDILGIVCVRVCVCVSTGSEIKRMGWVAKCLLAVIDTKECIKTTNDKATAYMYAICL